MLYKCFVFADPMSTDSIMDYDLDIITYCMHSDDKVNEEYVIMSKSRFTRSIEKQQKLYFHVIHYLK